ncbi:hypothetical protein BDV93DRAFT_563645 [Ceratobasidium sp. AG-I]|nr:hypothetical protein BDV93DRAFT_563645 [Ceratobasidium sp. AG-I]
MPSRSHYGKSVTPTSPIPQIPTLLLPARDPVHARLRGKALKKYYNRADDDAKAADAKAGQGVTTDDEEVSETDPDVPSRPQRIPSQPLSAPPELDNAAGPVFHPNSPSLAPSDLLLRERNRVVAAHALAEATKLLGGQRASRLIAKSTAAPLTRSQPRPPPGASGDVPLAHAQGTRRLDPISHARTDMIMFNEAIARDEAASFVQSATRQSKRTARCAAPSSRPLYELLDDDEELLAQAEAFAKKKWPASSSSARGRNRKQKPLARDVSGIPQQILILAKIHLLAYALVQGVYQTCATYIRWASSVHFATWQMELPTTPFEPPPHEHFEIMVNSIATLRSKVKERLHPFTASVAGFKQCTTNQAVIQDNLRKFNLIYPNSFHCKSLFPRKGHYESPEVAHCIAVALFHSPGCHNLF